VARATTRWPLFEIADGLIVRVTDFWPEPYEPPPGRQQQVDGMLAAGYARSEILGSEVTVLNSTSALYRGTFSRQRSDGGEINRLTATYLVTDGAAGRRISVLAVHSP
jgi:hypothetical protein